MGGAAGVWFPRVAVSGRQSRQFMLNRDIWSVVEFERFLVSAHFWR